MLLEPVYMYEASHDPQLNIYVENFSVERLFTQLQSVFRNIERLRIIFNH